MIDNFKEFNAAEQTEQQQLPHERLINRRIEYGDAKRNRIMNNLLMRINM